MKASVFLSDTHIIETGDEGDKALDLFFHHERVKNASRIVLLGDIFDYASGFHRQYYQRFSTFFNGIEQCIQSGQEVYFIEGNHDVHLEKLIRSFLKRKKLDQSLYFHEQRSMVVEWYGKRIFLSHGDDIGVSNKKYQDYKNFILSKPINLISNHLFPLWLFDYLAKDASVKSRKRNSEFYNKEEIAEEFLTSIRSHQLDVDHIICGHSHISENADLEGVQYSNNGFPPKDRLFTLLDKDGVKFISLDS